MVGHFRGVERRRIGDGIVRFNDFLLFARAYGARRGEEAFEDRFDLDPDDAIGFSDFLLFAKAYGAETP